MTKEKTDLGTHFNSSNYRSEVIRNTLSVKGCAVRNRGPRGGKPPARLEELRVGRSGQDPRKGGVSAL